MAEKTKFIETIIKSEMQFTNKGNKRLNIAFFNDMIKFQINDGSFKDPGVTVYFKDLAYNETKMVMIINKVLADLKVYMKNPDDPIKFGARQIVYSNNRAYKEATSMLAVGFYTNDDKKPSLYIKLAKKASKDDKEWKDSAIMFFSAESFAPGILAKDHSIELSDGWCVFTSIRDIFQAFSDRTSPKREDHWKRYISENKDNKQSGSSNSKSSSESVQEDLADVDDFEW